ncbi:MAG: sulfite oxidase heme-binding subunit YedZ [Dongiaceae bacterium]
MPWHDSAGRVSPFKLAVFLLLFIPAAVIAARYLGGSLGPRPLNEAVHQLGNWTLKLVLISLAVTPSRSLLQWPRLMQVRRMVGVAAFVYAAAHLTLYAADEAFDLGKVATEIVLRIYLTIGFAALLILVAMAATSTNGMVRRLGGRRWRRLHRLVYVAALLGVVHFFMQVKANVDEPWVMAGLFAWLMGYRALLWFGPSGGRLAAWAPTLLAVLAAAGTALGEALYYWLKLGAPSTRVLAANLSLDAGLRPACIVLAICLAVAALATLRRLFVRFGPLLRGNAARVSLRGDAASR